jgi:hypothetical protein
MNVAHAECGTLPRPYQILPHQIPFYVPGFRKQARATDLVLAPMMEDCGTWFESFADRVSESIGKHFLPVCRMSDGEFSFLFSQQPPNLRLPAAARFQRGMRQALGSIRRRLTGFHASTAPGVSSGDLTPEECREYRTILSSDYLTVLEKGILAIHLSFGQRPFQEHYFPALGSWLADSGHQLTTSNYAPFYFVYALLRGPRMRNLLTGRRVLLVHSAVGRKREAIARALSAFAPRSIEWLTISPNRSFADTLDLNSIAESPEICLVGAGIGKPRILMQLEPLHAPCIDAGFAFEVWAEPDRQWDRPYMTPDEDFDAAQVRFLSAEDRSKLIRPELVS